MCNGRKISIIITILSALLTGGFLMLFIESQQRANSVAERFHLRMGYFYHCFTNYVRFISSFAFCYGFENPKGYMKKLKDDLECISRLGGKSIISGQEYSANFFTAKQLDAICETINDIWYCIDKDYQGFQKVKFNASHAASSCEHSIPYIEEIFPKYKNITLNKELLSKVSGDFYVDYYQPISNILPQYELWIEKEKSFRNWTLFTIILTTLTMLLILLFRSYIPMWVFTSLCVACCGLLGTELYKLLKLEDYSKEILR